MSFQDESLTVLPFVSPTRHRNKTEIIGRDAVLEDVRHALLVEGVPVLTVWGPPGVGKTRLAQEMEWLSDSGKAVYVCRLAEVTDAMGLLGALAMSLELSPLEPGIGTQRAIEQLRLAMRQRRDALWILDNAEHLAQPLREVLDQCPDRPQVLVTSRVPLGMRKERRVELATLDPQDAMSLFIERARHIHPDFDLASTHNATLTRLLEALDHLPLAIELAASRLALLSPEQLLKRMNQRFRLLRPGQASAPLQLISLKDAIEASWAPLTVVLQQALAQMTIFGASFSLSAAEDVVALSDPDEVWLGDVIEELLYRSLLHVRNHTQTRERRYYMLLSVRDFARAHLQGPDAARERHARHFQRVAQELRGRRHGARGMAAVRQAEAELSNFAEAAECLLGLGDEAGAATLLLDMEIAYLRRGDAASYLKRLESCASLFESPPLGARWRGVRARLHGRLGARHRAPALCEEAAGALECAGLRADALLTHTHASALLNAQQLDRAEEILQESLRHTAPEEDVALKILWVWLVLGRADFRGSVHEEELEQTGALLDELEERIGQEPDALMLPKLLQARSLWLKHHEEGFEPSIRVLERALEVCRQQGRWDMEAVMLAYGSHAYQAGGHSERALDAARRAVDVISRAGMLSLQPLALYQLANIASELGELDLAITTAREGLRSANVAQAPYIEIFIQRILIGSLYESELYEDVRAVLTNVSDAQLDPSSEALFKLFEALLLAHDGAFEQAKDVLTVAIELNQQQYFFQGDGPVKRWETLRSICQCLVELERAGGWVERRELEPAQRILQEAREVLGRVRQEIGEERHLLGFVRALSRRVQGWNARLPMREIAHRIRASEDGAWFELDGAERVSIGHRKTLQRLLGAFLEHHPRGLSVEALVAAGWPGEIIEETSATNRVYAGIRALRRLGLSEVIVTDDSGYHIREDVYIERVHVSS